MSHYFVLANTTTTEKLSISDTTKFKISTYNYQKTNNSSKLYKILLQ